MVYAVQHNVITIKELAIEFKTSSNTMQGVLRAAGLQPLLQARRVTGKNSKNWRNIVKKMRKQGLTESRQQQKQKEQENGKQEEA